LLWVHPERARQFQPARSKTPLPHVKAPDPQGGLAWGVAICTSTDLDLKPGACPPP
jgi:hypothetical protein